MPNSSKKTETGAKKTNQKFKGVLFRKDRNKYRAYINVDGKRQWLGNYDTAEEAAETYDQAAWEYFGNMAEFNFFEVGGPSKLENKEIAANERSVKSSGKKNKNELNNQITDLLLEKGEELSVRYKNNQSRAHALAAARELVFNNRLEKSLEKIFKNKVVVPKYEFKNKGKINREVTLCLSDLHVGADLDPEEVPLAFGKVEESRRFSSIVKQTADYKRQYRANTKLNIFIFGDLIAGKMHDKEAHAALSEQCARIIYLLVQGISFLCSQFPVVEVSTQSGNHDRWSDGRHKERAVDAKWDSLGTVIYYAVKMALKDVKNLKFEIPKTPYIIKNIFDKKVMVVHGDSLMNLPFASSNINVKSVKNQLNELNATLGAQDKIDLMIGGHTHSPLIVRLNNVTLLVNGCMISTDAYCLSKGIFKTDTGQQLFESVPGYILGDNRFLQVNEKTDKDTSLDTIIKPFEGF